MTVIQQMQHNTSEQENMSILKKVIVLVVPDSEKLSLRSIFNYIFLVHVSPCSETHAMYVYLVWDRPLSKHFLLPSNTVLWLEGFNKGMKLNMNIAS